MTKSCTPSELHALMVQALCKHNTSSANAVLVADALAGAECQGLGGHGLSRLEAYCGQAASGKVNGQAEIQLEEISSALTKIDAGNGFAYPAIEKAIDVLLETTPNTGLACVLMVILTTLGRQVFS